MEFVFVTDHDQKAFTTGAMVLRKTVRRSLSIIIRVIGCIIVAMLLLFTMLPFIFMLDDREFLMLGMIVAVPVVIFFVLIIVLPFVFEDYLNGFIAKKRALPGTSKTTAVFTAEGYTITTEIAKTEYQYNSASLIAETNDYFVFVLGNNYAQIFSKKGICRGSVDYFREFIVSMTNKPLLTVKG